MCLILVPLVNHKEKTYFFSLNIAQFSSMSKVATDNASLKSCAELNDALERLYCTSYQYPCILYPLWCQMVFTLTRPLWFDPINTNETVAGFQDSIVVFIGSSLTKGVTRTPMPCCRSGIISAHRENIISDTLELEKISERGWDRVGNDTNVRHVLSHCSVVKFSLETGNVAEVEFTVQGC